MPRTRNGRKHMKQRRLFVGTVAALVCVAAAAVIAMLILNLSGPTAEVRLSPPRSETGESSGGAGESTGESTVYAALRPDTVQFALSAIEKPESYSCRYTVESFWEGGESLCRVTVRLRDGLIRVRQETAKGEKNFLLTEEEYWLWYGEDGEVFHGSREGVLAGSDLAEAVQMSGSYEDLMALDPSAISETAYEPLDGQPCIYVRAVTGRLGYVSDYYIAPDTGLLLKNEIWDGERLVYRLQSEEIVLSTPEEGEFLIPGE